MFKTLGDIDCRGRRILVRGDLNVPVRDGAVTDTTRLDRLAPTLLELAEKGAKVVVLSHFGRPKGEVVPELTLRQIADALSVSLGGRPAALQVTRTRRPRSGEASTQARLPLWGARSATGPRPSRLSRPIPAMSAPGDPAGWCPLQHHHERAR